MLNIDTNGSAREGQPVPDVTFRNRSGNDWQELSSRDVFADKTVVLFALPGAFTPTCSSSHLPRYNELAPLFRQQGVDTVACLSVNDGFVMQAWAADQHADNIQFLADGNGDFSRGMGMLVGKRELGFGERSWRYSMLVRDGVIEKMFVEPDRPGDPFEVSDADTMLRHLNPEAQPPQRITLFTKPGCSHCIRAKLRLSEAGLRYEEVRLGEHGVSLSTLAAVSGRGSTPQVFVEGELIGGADELEQWLQSN